MVRDHLSLLISLAKERQRMLAGKPDLIYVRNDPMYLVFALLFLGGGRRPIVFQLSHLKEEEVLASARKASWRNKLKLLAKGGVARCLRNWGMLRCDHVFPISEAMKDVLVEQGLQSGRMTVIPLGVDSGQEAASVATKSGQKYMVYIGTMAQCRGLETVMGAFSRVTGSYPDCELVMIGGGETPEGRESLIRLARKLGIAEKVRFLGQMPRRNVYGFIKAAVLGLSAIPIDPVNKTLSPTKLMEYLQCGCPVVATRGIEDQERIVKWSGGGLLVDFTEESIANGMMRLLGDRQMARAMGAHGRRYILRERSYDKMVLTVDEVLRRINHESVIQRRTG
jgi:glycosyltransferase involved in cell wall biosynthesis